MGFIGYRMAGVASDAETAALVRPVRNSANWEHTLLCSLLYSTGVLGRPESYLLREPDEVAWAARFGLATEGERVRDYRAFVNAAHSAGASDNGVFGVRIMWGSLERVIEGLGGVPGESDLPILEEALGPLTFVHLRREDIAAQAVSWCRAEQTGYWQQGDVITQEPHPDIAQTRVLMGTIRKHNAPYLTRAVSSAAAHLIGTDVNPRRVVSTLTDLLGRVVWPLR
jgi:LPS sulfotransferase NodH